MSVLEAVRTLNDDPPVITDRAGYGECYYCSAPNYEETSTGTPKHKVLVHAADCPWLILPKIAAALEAAKRVDDEWGTTLDGVPSLAAMQALRSALED